MQVLQAKSNRALRKGALRVLFLLLTALLVAMPLVTPAEAAGITVEILAGYNLVVDSNASSPSTRVCKCSDRPGRAAGWGGTVPLSPANSTRVPVP